MGWAGSSKRVKKKEENWCYVAGPTRISEEKYAILGIVKKWWDVLKRKVLRNEWDGVYQFWNSETFVDGNMK